MITNTFWRIALAHDLLPEKALQPSLPVRPTQPPVKQDTSPTKLDGQQREVGDAAA